MFHDSEYVAWANEGTIHVLSYCLDKAAKKPEPVVEADRDGVKVEVLALYPMFTAGEAETLVNDTNSGVVFPMSTPWSGVVSPVDGTSVLAEMKNGTAKEFRALYEAEQKKLGPTVPRAAWKKAVANLSASTEAEFDEKFAEAVKLAIEAKGLVKSPPKPLAERLQARLDGLDKIGRDRLEAAQKEKDAAARKAAISAVAAEFRGLPAADAATEALAPK